MSQNLNAETAQKLADEAAKLGVVPAQANSVPQLEDVQHDAIGALQDSLIAVEKNMMHVYGVGVDVRIVRDEASGEFKVEVVDPNESKIKSLFGKAKGLVQRNKKLVIATASLLVASAILKVAANWQEDNVEVVYDEESNTLTVSGVEPTDA